MSAKQPALPDEAARLLALTALDRSLLVEAGASFIGRCQPCADIGGNPSALLFITDTVRRYRSYRPCSQPLRHCFVTDSGLSASDRKHGSRPSDSLRATQAPLPRAKPNGRRADGGGRLDALTL